MKKLTEEARFRSKFEESDGCWTWTAGLGVKGYGHFWFRGRPQPAHRVSFKLFKQDIDDGVTVMHSCDNRLCVNPSHLSLGSNQENTADMVAKGRQAKGSDVAAAKLDESMIQAIRDDTRSQRKIAADYRVSHTVIGHIKSRILWRHV